MEDLKCKLPKAFVEKWTKELRSGDYNQITKTLTYAGAYCCLGVALKMDGVEDSVLSTASLPGNLQPNIKGSYPTNHMQQDFSWDFTLEEKFASLNDDDSYTFEEIADWIDENIEAV